MKYELHEDELVIYVNQDIYSKSTVLKTAYIFVDRCYVHIDISNQQYVIELSSKSGCQLPLETLAGEFLNELLNQEVRESIAKETKDNRQLV